MRCYKYVLSKTKSAVFVIKCHGRLCYNFIQPPTKSVKSDPRPPMCIVVVSPIVVSEGVCRVSRRQVHFSPLFPLNGMSIRLG